MNAGKKPVLDILMRVEAFLRFDLSGSIANCNRLLVPETDWKPFLEGYREFSEKRGCLTSSERGHVESLFTEASANLNFLLEVIRNALNAKNSGEEGGLRNIALINDTIKRVRDRFAKGVAEFERMIGDDFGPIGIDRSSSAGQQPVSVSQELNSAERIFIVHGHDLQTRRALSDFLQGLGKEPVVLNEVPSGGRTVMEKFEHYGADVQYAVILLTPDDIGGVQSSATCQQRARQNVIFELGYFIGKLGRGRVCLMCKGDLELPSDLNGVVYIPLDAQNQWGWALVQEFLHAKIGLDAALVAQACQRLMSRT